MHDTAPHECIFCCTVPTNSPLFLFFFAVPVFVVSIALLHLSLKGTSLRPKTSSRWSTEARLSRRVDRWKSPSTHPPFDSVPRAWILLCVWGEGSPGATELQATSRRARLVPVPPTWSSAGGVASPRIRQTEGLRIEATDHFCDIKPDSLMMLPSFYPAGHATIEEPECLGAVYKHVSEEDKGPRVELRDVPS